MHLCSFLTTSRRQGQIGDGLSEGSRLANPRADEQKPRIRPRDWKSEPKITNSTEGSLKVNMAAVWRMFVFLPREISEICGWGVPSAPKLETAWGNSEKSAEGILAKWHS